MLDHQIQVILLARESENNHPIILILIEWDSLIGFYLTVKTFFQIYSLNNCLKFAKE